jgi:hypothetical protein
MLALLLACASTPSPDTSDTSGTAPKMIEAECELSGPEFLVPGYTDLPPAAVIYLGAEADDGSIGWRLAQSVAYVDGVLHISAGTSTRCLAYIQ